MRSNPENPPAPMSPGKVGAAFVTAPGGDTVRPATDRGEANPLPTEHCTATRKHFETGVGGY